MVNAALMCNCMFKLAKVHVKAITFMCIFLLVSA